MAKVIGSRVDALVESQVGTKMMGGHVSVRVAHTTADRHRAERDLADTVERLKRWAGKLTKVRADVRSEPTQP